MADNEIVPIEIGDLTKGIVNGNGVFDKIMSTVDVRLTREYDLNRIKGTDYSKVYLGTMEAAMQQSIIFLLGKDKAANEAALIQAQILLAEANKDKVLAEIVLLGLQAPKIEAEIRAIDAGILKTGAEISLIGKQEEKIDKDILLIDEQIIQMGFENDILKFKLDFMLPKELEKITAEISLMGYQESKIEEEIKVIQYQHEYMLPAEVSKITASNALMGKQGTKFRRDRRLDA